MDQETRHRTLGHVEEMEGSLFYSDANGREALPVLGVLTLALHQERPTSQPNAVWCQTGYHPAVIQALATYFVNTPGLKEAVDGFYHGMLIQQQQAAIQQALQRQAPKG